MPLMRPSPARPRVFPARLRAKPVCQPPARMARSFPQISFVTASINATICSAVACWEAAKAVSELRCCKAGALTPFAPTNRTLCSEQAFRSMEAFLVPVISSSLSFGGAEMVSRGMLCAGALSDHLGVLQAFYQLLSLSFFFGVDCGQV
jgi:hypothetical protein